VSSLALPVVCHQNQRVDVDSFSTSVQTKRVHRDYFTATITGLPSHLLNPNLTLTPAWASVAAVSSSEQDHGFTKTFFGGSS
jgi:metal-dependent amidase/aminoacylase/carboxypeptidase family protein